MATERIDIVVSERGTRTVRRNLEGIGKSAQASQGAVQLLRRSLGLLGGALAIGNLIRTLADFGQAMSTVKAITGATEQQFKALGDTAKQLGATTRFSATEAAEGMQFLARAGFNTDEVLASIGDTLQLAQAGALGLAEAADIASNVLKGFNLEADETTRIVDVMTLTANSANTNVQQLGQAMSFLAPAAAAVGVSVELAAASVGALSDAGVQSTRAGTALRQIFVKLLKPTAAGVKALQRMSLTTKDVDIETRGLVPVLETLRQKNVSLTEATELVGVRNAANLLILTKSIPKIKELSAANEGAAGTAAKMAEIMDDNLKGALFAVRSAFESVIIAIGDLGANQTLINFFRGIASVLRSAAKNIDDVAAAFVFLASAAVLPKVIGLIKLLTLAIAANPIGAFVTAIVGLTSVVILLRDQINLTTDGTLTLGNAMEGASQTIGTSVVQAVNLLGGEFSNFGGLVDRVMKNFGQVILLALATFNGVIQAMIATLKDFPRALRELAVLAWNGFLKIATTALRTFGSVVEKFLALLFSDKTFKFDLSFLEIDAVKGGTLIGNAFKQGFVDTIGAGLDAGQQSTVDALFDVGPAITAPVAPGAAPGAAAGAGRGGAGAGRTTEFETLLNNLKQEGELLKLNTAERLKREAVLTAEDELKRKLTDTERAQIEATVTNNEKIAAQRALLEELRGPQEQYENNVKLITQALKDQVITQDEATRALRDNRIALLEGQQGTGAGLERGFLKAQKNMEDFATSSERLITDAFSEAQNAVVGFFKTGKFEADSFFQSLADNFIKLGVQQGFAAIFGGGGGGFGGGGGSTGGFNIGSLVGSLFSSGFANGGQFSVGASSAAARLPGIDNRLIAFKARDGETVTVTKPGEAAPAQPINQVFNIQTKDADSFRRSQTQIQNRADAALTRTRTRR
jgi:TP901 family phage tail tape measure protein